MKYRFKKSITLAVLGLCLLVLAACGGQGQKPQQISQEEQAFFQGQVLRNVSNLSKEELQTAVQQVVGEVHAVYRLGSELGLCEPFDFAVLQQQWEQENASREQKRETGETYYGPDELSLDVYFPYQYSALQSDIVTKLLDERDADLVADARCYYEEHPEIFTQITAVTYEATMDGVTTAHTITAEEFRFYGQSNPQLMDFLAAAEDGEETILSTGDSEYTVRRTGVSTELLPFAENERIIVEMFLRHERLAQWLDQIAAAHELVF